jgi:uncharacterized protein (DUF1501 family)
LVENGTRVVQVNWPVAVGSDPFSWDTHSDLTDRVRNHSGPILDLGLSGLLTDLGSRGMLERTMVVAVGEFGRNPVRGVSTSGNATVSDGRDHWSFCYGAIIAGAGIKRGYVHGESDRDGAYPTRDAVHPAQLLATIYKACGVIHPDSTQLPIDTLFT